MTATVALPIDPFQYVITPLGEAEARWLIIFGFDVPDQIVVWQRETKEYWRWPNHLVRQCESVSASRPEDHSPIHVSHEMFDTLAEHILRHKRSPLYERAMQYHRGE